MRKTILAIATAVALGTATMTTGAMAAGHGGGHFVGGGAHFGGGHFAGGHYGGRGYGRGYGWWAAFTPMAAPRTAIAAAIPTITATTTADPLTTAGNCFPGYEHAAPFTGAQRVAFSRSGRGCAVA